MFGVGVPGIVGPSDGWGAGLTAAAALALVFVAYVAAVGRTVVGRGRTDHVRQADERAPRAA